MFFRLGGLERSTRTEVLQIGNKSVAMNNNMVIPYNTPGHSSGGCDDNLQFVLHPATLIDTVNVETSVRTNPPGATALERRCVDDQPARKHGQQQTRTIDA